MSYRDVFDVFKRERRLSDDETALLNSLRHMTDAERELLAETLGPPTKVKVTRAVVKRKIEHCEVCDYTRRALLHKDPNVSDYHEFVPRSSSKPKSARASSLAEKIAGTTGARPAITDDEDGPCGKCGNDGDNNVHHKRTDPDYHPFVPVVLNAAESSSPTSESSKGGQLSTQSSAVEMASASSVTGG